MNKLQIAAQGRLETISPMETDKGLMVKLRSICPELRIEERSIFSESGFAGTQISKIERPRGITQGQIDNAARSLSLALLPANPDTLLNLLQRLSMSTKSRNKSSKDFAQEIAFYADELTKSPADIVVDVLKINRQWWPSLGELLEEIAPKAYRRQALLDQVETWQPWTESDELLYLQNVRKDIAWHARYYKRSKPELSSKYAAKLEHIEAKIKVLN